MNPYRILKLSELEPLQAEFVQFLSANGIDAAAWTKIQEEQQGQMDLLLSQFSRIVWEKVLGKVDLVEKLDGQILYMVKFGDDEALLIGIEFAEGAEEYLWQNIPDDHQINIGQNNIRCFSVIKSYSKSRAEELYFLIELGYQVSEKLDLFHDLAQQLGLILPESRQTKNEL